MHRRPCSSRPTSLALAQWSKALSSLLTVLAFRNFVSYHTKLQQAAFRFTLPLAILIYIQGLCLSFSVPFFVHALSLSEWQAKPINVLIVLLSALCSESMLGGVVWALGELINHLMGVEESERRSFSVTEPQHVADLEESRNGRVQRQPRQAPSIIQISTIVSRIRTAKYNQS